jgi:formamidase
VTHNRWHPAIEPVAVVAPGDELRLETEDGLAGGLTPESTHADAGRLNLGLPHPLAGPVLVEGAEPGDLLEVQFLLYETSTFGVTAIIPDFGYLADLFPHPFVAKWTLAEGLARSPELPGVAVPEETFAGVAGVAPSHEQLERFRQREEALRGAGHGVAEAAPEEAAPDHAAGGLRTIPPRETGGNLDIRQLVAGSKLWLPVQVPGALFSVGDLHYAQGDGEVCGTAIEVAGAVTVRFRVVKGAGGRLRFPSYETPARPGRRSFATTGIPVEAGMSLDVAVREALLEMIGHLQDERGFSRPAAYALCSVCVDLRLSEVVDLPYPLVSALLPLDVFEDAPRIASA